MLPTVLMSGPMNSVFNDSKLVWGIKRAFRGASARELFHVFNVKFSSFGQ